MSSQPSPGQDLAQLPRPLLVAADRGAQRRHAVAQLDHRAALERRRAGQGREDRHAGGGDHAGDVRLLAAAHADRHAADDRAARDRHQRVAHVHGLREALPHRGRLDDLDAGRGQRGDQPLVLGGRALEIGWPAVGPVPAAGRVDERLELRVPGVGADAGQGVPRRPDEHGAQRADLVVGAPRAAPHRLDLGVEGGLGRRGHARLVEVCGPHVRSGAISGLPGAGRTEPSSGATGASDARTQRGPSGP